MNKVIVLDGADNLGKTYLIEILHAKYPHAISIHFGAVKTRNESKKAIFKVVDDLNKIDNNTFLFDRSPLAEFVYGYYRKYDPYTIWNDVAEKFKGVNAKFLHISFLADGLTYMQFDLKPKKDEKVKYQFASEAKVISDRFVVLNERLKMIPAFTTMLVDCNKYDSLNSRNKICLDVIDRWLDDEVLVRCI